jgi:thiol-disulfide isomerase/thioredoxin
MENFKVLLLILILVALYLNNQEKKNKKERYKKLEDEIIIMIFVADWCPACKDYKENEHNKIKDELLKENKNIKFKFIENNEENDELFQENKIKYLPSVIVDKNGKKEKLDKMITTKNIKELF